jgi:uncharacterized protein YjbJ (UPF0337 family)
MQIKNKCFSFLTIFSLVFLIAACEKEGPAEKAGGKIDQAVENTQEKVEETVDKIDQDGPAEEVGETLDETAEKIKDEAQQVKEDVEENME